MAIETTITETTITETNGTEATTAPTVTASRLSNPVKLVPELGAAAARCTRPSATVRCRRAPST